MSRRTLPGIVGTAHHPMDLSVDLPDLMQSLEDHEVYVFKKGRSLDDDDLPVPDIISSGLNELLNGKSSPLNDYNTAFIRLQLRRRLVPLVNGQDSDPCRSNEVPPPAGTQIDTAAPSDLVQPLDVGDRGAPVDSSDEDSDEEDEESQGNANESANEDNDSENENEDLEADDEDIGDFLRSFEDTSDEGSLGLESAADVSLDMDAEDLGDEEDLFNDEDALMSESDDDVDGL